MRRLKLKAYAEQEKNRKEAAAKRKAIETQIKRVEKKRKSIEEASVYSMTNLMFSAAH